MHRVVVFFSNLSYGSDARTSMEQEIAGLVKPRAHVLGIYHRQRQNAPPVCDRIKEKIARAKQMPREAIINVVFHASCSVSVILTQMDQLQKKLQGHTLVYYYYKTEGEYLGKLSKKLLEYSEFESKLGIATAA